MAFNINTFVRAGELIPGGFTGLTLLIQEIGRRFGNVRLPFSLIYYILNAAPALICFRVIGKKFAVYSCLMVLLSGFLTDWMPDARIAGINVAVVFTEFLQLHDTLLSAVFGGLLNALAIALCLYAGATSGGTDFIAIFIAERYRKNAWNYILAGNCVVLAVAAFLFALDKALYSIIFQFTATVSLSTLYRSYQQRTLLIITGKSEEIYALIRDKTNHGATSFRGTGNYEKAERVLLYSVVAANEVPGLMTEIKKIDENAFVNVLRTEQINGRFYQRPKD